MKQNAKTEITANAAIRRRAWRLYWKNRGFLWVLFFLYSIFIASNYLLKLYVILDLLASAVFSLILNFIMYPVTSIGMKYVMLRLIDGKPTSISMLFAVFKPPYQIKTLYTASLIMCLSFIIAVLQQLTQIPALNTLFQSILLAACGLIFIIVILWILLRLFLLPYLVILHPNESAWSLCKTSFQRMKGQVKHLMWFGITIYILPALLFIAMVALYITINIYSYPRPPITGYTIAFYFLLIFLSPFISLASAGFANELLSDNVSKKARRKSVRQSSTE